MKSLLTMIQNLIKRGYVSKSLKDNKDYPITQVSYFGKVGFSEVLSPYGLASRLPEDIQVVIWNIDGYENNRLCMGYSQTPRFKDLKEGEVVVGNPLTNSYVKFKQDGSIEIESKDKLTVSVAGDIDLTVTGNVNINAPLVNLGSGGNAIARSGDPVKVDVGGTDYFGTITSGGTNTSI